MTPEVLSFNGRCEVSPPNIRLPTLALRVLHQDAALRALHEDDEGDDARPTDQEQHDEHGRDRTGAAELEGRAIACGSWATMPAKMISEMPLPTPRAVICSPSHIKNTVPPVSVITG